MIFVSDPGFSSRLIRVAGVTAGRAHPITQDTPSHVISDRRSTMPPTDPFLCCDSQDNCPCINLHSVLFMTPSPRVDPVLVWCRASV